MLLPRGAVANAAPATLSPSNSSEDTPLGRVVAEPRKSAHGETSHCILVGLAFLLGDIARLIRRRSSRYCTHPV